MSNSDFLRRNKSQHLPKNVLSKGDDKKVSAVMKRVIEHLNTRFNLANLGYYLEYVKSIKLSELIGIIKGYDKRAEFSPLSKEDSYIKPDGGILVLRKKDDENYRRIALAVEMKHQGTNKKRIAEGLKKQSQGNAIERLGKNLIGIRATLQYEKITPFVCFGWGDDFAEGSSIRDRVITMNEFYPLNRIFIHKKEGYAPVSMFFRENAWQENELFEHMKEIAEASITTYIY
ncbi:MAG: restriction endonuclease [Candidatus Niyogibacteria bacterium]|nr:restriction endonuclease [Candidatus Niyogibacteria bacterium]